MCADGGHDALLNKRLTTVKKFEHGAEVGGMLGEAFLVDGRSDIYRDSMNVGEAKLLKSEEQVGAVQTAAEHGDDRSISVVNLCKLLKAFNRPAALLRQDAVAVAVDFQSLR